ncbi:hypothetical_protein [Leishmania braziliensis MHOM/BR/75/M2904]|uniref:Hypothetical_protein n=1 Tax=Leishmania braziliensis MHOM/BR/75/M2904 TaxID=420245 RepID=A0A3P3ZGK2_LEIBR|nr:unnamed protein product [Leishmania braziliensis]SYZ69225.1 hypothetical_protein [Leishmania braziliensis MHOM/BR/75/M2904]
MESLWRRYGVAQVANGGGQQINAYINLLPAAATGIQGLNEIIEVNLHEMCHHYLPERTLPAAFVSRKSNFATEMAVQWSKARGIGPPRSVR